MATEDSRFTVETLLSLPRIGGLTLSPGGERLVVSASLPDAKGKKFVSALYEVDLRGEESTRRLTRSTAGESGPRFAPDGSLLFTSARPDPDADPDKDGDEQAALWALPARGGEARVVAAPPGGVEAVAVARESRDLVYAAGRYPEAGSEEEDSEKEKARKEAGVGAQLFTEYPIRLWDRYLGPRERHLALVSLPKGDEPVGEGRDLVPSPGRSLDMAAFDLTPDGATLVSGRWCEAGDPRDRRLELIAIDAASREQRVLAAAEDAWFVSPAASPDGRHVVVVRSGQSTPEEVADNTLWLVDLETCEGRDLLPGFDLWPTSPVWSHLGDAVIFTADEDGRVPVFRVDVASGAVERLTGEGSYSSPCPAPDGTVYALRSTVSEPPRPVALGEGGERPLPGFGAPELPSRVERVTAKASDGTPVRSWLVLPPGASAESPAPLATFIHGGPVNSWTGWHWRWSPHALAEEGWAVLLPDPALSTGYGLKYIQRGWGRWGDVVYGDLMSAVDDAERREEIDAGRTVAMGGSFGGYMANWIAGQTDRFDALVTHASLWDLETFHGTTDLGVWWEREFGDLYEQPARYRAHSPHRHAASLSTPMLVIHGELDYRVPIGEALALWTALKRHQVPAEFLYFPDENHWIQKPNNVRLWYQSVLGFIGEHARGRSRKRPELL